MPPVTYSNFEEPHTETLGQPWCATSPIASSELAGQRPAESIKAKTWPKSGIARRRIEDALGDPGESEDDAPD